MNKMKLSYYELQQLRSIGGIVYGDGRPYWWGQRTMPKLAAKGLVEPHPEQPRAWRITDAGSAEFARQFPNAPSGTRLP